MKLSDLNLQIKFQDIFDSIKYNQELTDKIEYHRGQVYHYQNLFGETIKNLDRGHIDIKQYREFFKHFYLQDKNQLLKVVKIYMNENNVCCVDTYVVGTNPVKFINFLFRDFLKLLYYKESKLVPINTENQK